MQAVVFKTYGSADVLSFQEVTQPSPKPNEVLIKVQAVSINDWDPGLIAGKPYIIRTMFGLRKPNIHIPGVDVAGRIEAVGNEVQRFKPGDLVYGDLSESRFGAFAEYVCAPENAIIHKPHNMTVEEAAAIPHAAMLAWQGLEEKGEIRSGQRVLINGAGGGVGTLGIQMAKRHDVHVTGVDSAQKLDMLTKLGYDQVIDYRKKDFTVDTSTYDLILDVKTNRPVSHYARALRPGGRYITVGGSMSRILQTVLIGPWISMFKGKKLQVLSLEPNKNLQTVNELYEAGKLKPVIDGPYTFGEIPDLIGYFAAGQHRGKIVVKL